MPIPPYLRLVRHLLAAPVLVVPATLVAQNQTSSTNPAELITAAEVGKHIGVIAADSMGGRDTPSRGLDATAEYVARQFEALGLKPAPGGNGTWLQRYNVPSVLDLAHSRLVFSTDSQKVEASFGTAAWLTRHVVPGEPKPAGVVLIAGRLTPEALQGVPLQDKIVLYVAPGRPEPLAEQQALQLIRPTNPAGLIILSNLDSTIFAWHLNRARRQPDVSFGDRWNAEVRLDAVPGLAAMLAANGVDFAHVRAQTAPLVRALPIQAGLDLRFTRTVNDSITAPNVVAVIEGSDPKLKKDYVLFVAHMDHTGIRHGQADSIANGADDNASGTAGLLALAKAFSHPDARPARSLVFLATSGGAKGLWGSHAFLDQITGVREMMQIFGIEDSDLAPITRLTAAFSLDMVGRKAGDSIVIDGMDDIDLPAPPVWLAAAHPELRLTVVDGGTATATMGGSDADAFVQQAVPTLHIHNGTHDTTDVESSVPIDPDLEARILQLIFYVGQDVANAKRAPEWNADGRRHYLAMFDH